MEKLKNKNLSYIIELIKEIKPYLIKKYNVKTIGIFGSYVRNEQQNGSDLDILVEFSKPIGLFSFIGMEREISEKLKIKVDLVMKNTLKPRIGKYILNEVIIL
jgi:uncharacterized protein